MIPLMRKVFFNSFVFLFTCNVAYCQGLTGKITDQKNKPVSDALVHLLNTGASAFTDSSGDFNLKNIFSGTYTIIVSAAGYAAFATEIKVPTESSATLVFQLTDATRQLDEVVVTAQKKEEQLQKIPLSISAFSSRQVQQLRLWNSNELTAAVPNLFAVNSGDERNVSCIRGIATTSYDPAVTTYIDGVNQFSLDTYIGALADVERIEVLRGPQGTLYGRNAMGGVINIITKQPTNKQNGFVELNFGNYGMQRYSAGLRTPLIKDKLFFGASGVFTKRDGYYTNEFNNSSFDNQNALTGNYYLKYLPDAKWGLTLNVKHQNNRNNGPFPLVNGVEDAFNDPFILSQDAVAKMIDNTLDVSLSINHTGHSINFSSQSAWQNNHRYYNAPLDGDFSPADAVTVINNYGNNLNNVKVFTQELKITSSANTSSPFKFTAGIYFFHQDNPSKQGTHFGKDAGLIGVPDTNFTIINSTKADNTGIAFYGQLSYAVSKKLEIIAGLRYDYENKKSDVLGEYQKDGEDAFKIRPDTSAALHYSAISPKLGLNYHVNEGSSLFATYSRGFRTGGLTQLSSDPSQPPLYPYKPEYSNNFETGLKNTFWNHRVKLNITAFITLVNNAQVPTLILPDAITVTKNTGKLNTKGAELELSSTPVKGLEVDYNFGYTHATYTSFKISQNGSEVDLDGKKQIFTPDVTSMLALQYTGNIDENGSAKFVIRSEWIYIGNTYFDFANNIKQSPYNLLNARAGISLKHFDLFFWARNFGNKKYIEYAYDFGAVHLGAPKTYGITLGAKF